MVLKHNLHAILQHDVNLQVHGLRLRLHTGADIGANLPLRLGDHTKRKGDTISVG